MKTVKLIILFISLSISMQGQEVWTLEKCIKRAIEKNISIKQSQADLESTSLNKTTAIANFLPSLNLGSSHSWNVGLNQNITTGLLENMTTRSASMNANMGIDLFNGLQNIQQLYRANLSILASQYQLADMKENISLLVANSYLQILFNRESLGVQQSQLNVANEELIIAQERLKTGIIPMGDVLEIEANVATIEQNVVVAENNFQLSKIALAQLLLIPDFSNFEIAQETAITPEPAILSTNVNTIYSKAVAKRNDVKLAETNLKIAKKDLAISRGSILPKLSGFYSYNSRILFDDPSDISHQLDRNAGQNFGLQLSIPIFNGMANNTNIRRSKINIQKSTYALEQVKLDLENTINQAYNDAKGSLKAHQAAEKTLKARKLAYEYAKERFDNGGMNTFNFLQAGQRYEAAQSEMIKTKYNYIFKLKVLEFYFGEVSL
ncbi:MAG TPA: TolC family protein [Flavobacteriales bacterium]|nr:TolC family protein [Flavobacteriales bacterium]